MKTTLVSDKYQVVIPKEIREKLAIKRGQKLVAHVLDSYLVMHVQTSNYTKKLKGLGKSLWKNIDPIEYIRKEREQWTK